LVDTSLHRKRWTREQAIACLDETLPTNHEANREEVERWVAAGGG